METLQKLIELRDGLEEVLLSIKANSIKATNDPFPLDLLNRPVTPEEAYQEDQQIDSMDFKYFLDDIENVMLYRPSINNKSVDEIITRLTNEIKETIERARQEYTNLP